MDDWGPSSVDDFAIGASEGPLPEELEEAQEALSALSCPYYRGIGVCVSGCYTEPGCQTDEPTEGWVAQLHRAVDEYVDSITRGALP